MSKGHGTPRGMPNLNPAALQRQVQEMQQKLLQAQQALADETVTSTVGGGAVTVTMNGQQKAMEVKISPEALQDVEMLQDLILAAVNDAIERSQQLASERVGAVTGGLGLPGLG
jgi:nucleoid-associated protein EbfC